MGYRTPLYDKHVEAGARIVDFGGWDMPLHYGSQKNEHHAVRNGAGVFDVSHMTIVDVNGEQSLPFLQYLLSNDVGRLQTRGQALYTCMLTPQGGVIDDLIAYFLDDGMYRLIVNAATREKDLAWMQEQAGTFDVAVTERSELAMVAVQGPRARELASACFAARDRDVAMALQRFQGAVAGDAFVARTGYTGEDGWEIAMPADAAETFWVRLLASGVEPCGLGARDTLRLEAAMNLYGNDMDETISPLEAGLAWTIAWEPADRDFIGRAALEARRGANDLQQFAGLMLEDRGVLRSGQTVMVEGIGTGQITSGGYSPTLERSIALARLPAGEFEYATVGVRGKHLKVRVVETPFVKRGQTATSCETRVAH